MKLTENKYAKDRPSLCVCGMWGLALVVQSEPVRWHIPDTYCCLFTGIILLGRLQLSSAAISSLTFTSSWRPLQYIWAYDQLNFILQETKAPTKNKIGCGGCKYRDCNSCGDFDSGKACNMISLSLHSPATVNLEKLYSQKLNGLEGMCLIGMWKVTWWMLTARMAMILKVQLMFAHFHKSVTL